MYEGEFVYKAEGFVFLVSNLVAENPWDCILVHAPDLESLNGLSLIVL